MPYIVRGYPEDHGGFDAPWLVMTDPNTAVFCRDPWLFGGPTQFTNVAQARNLVQSWLNAKRRWQLVDAVVNPVARTIVIQGITELDRRGL